MHMNMYTYKTCMKWHISMRCLYIQSDFLLRCIFCKSRHSAKCNQLCNLQLIAGSIHWGLKAHLWGPKPDWSLTENQTQQIDGLRVSGLYSNSISSASECHDPMRDALANRHLCLFCFHEKHRFNLGTFKQRLKLSKAYVWLKSRWVKCVLKVKQALKYFSELDA